VWEISIVDTILMSKDSYLELNNNVTSHNYYGILSDSNGTIIANNVTTTFNVYQKKLIFTC